MRIKHSTNCTLHSEAHVTADYLIASPKQDDAAVSLVFKVFPSGKFEQESLEVVFVYGDIRRLTLIRSSLIL